MDKAALRSEILNKRNGYSDEERRLMSEAVSKRFFSLKQVEESKDILLYADFGSELKTDAIFTEAKRLGKRVFYPRVMEDKLIFYPVEALSELNTGYKGIREPDITAYADSFSPAAAALIPGVVFSRDGYRIGYGKGFYDRFLSCHKELFTLGASFAIQLCKQIPVLGHDERLRGVITEEECLLC